jgi:hypothetical protein
MNILRLALAAALTLASHAALAGGPATGSVVGVVSIGSITAAGAAARAASPRWRRRVD